MFTTCLCQTGIFVCLDAIKGEATGGILSVVQAEKHYLWTTFDAQRQPEKENLLDPTQKQ